MNVKDKKIIDILKPFYYFPWLLWGLLFLIFGTVMYIFGTLLVFPRYLLGLNLWLKPLNETIVWYSGMPILLGIILCLFDLLVLLPVKRNHSAVPDKKLADQKMVVALTAYNDELSIGQSVKDFLSDPRVVKVIVVSNNSIDATFMRAEQAGALTFNETKPGYGQCVFRCLKEALKITQSDLIVLCEGDCTFSAGDLDKFLAYAPHADIVNGTRTVERLRAYTTQLSTFMFYGNMFVGKLLEAKHVGKGTITDVGTTYKLCHRKPLEQLINKLDPNINMEFNAYFLDQALSNNLSIVECPITFHARVGKSKGGNINNKRAFKVGINMIIGIIFGWI